MPSMFPELVRTIKAKDVAEALKQKKRKHAMAFSVDNKVDDDEQVAHDTDESVSNHPLSGSRLHKTTLNFKKDNSVLSTEIDHHISPFLDLPPELRFKIYDFLFQDSAISVDPTFYLNAMRVEIHRESGSGIGVLMVCRKIYNEALLALRRNTTIIKVGTYGYPYTRLAVLQIPDEWKVGIKTIDYSMPSPRLHLLLSQFPNLENITIGVKLYHVDPDMLNDSNLQDKVLDYVKSKHPSLHERGREWISYLPSVHIVLRVLLHNHRKRCDVGWQAHIDTVTWSLLSIERAVITEIEWNEKKATIVSGDLFNEYRRTMSRAQWRNSILGWKVCEIKETLSVSK